MGYVDKGDAVASAWLSAHAAFLSLTLNPEPPMAHPAKEPWAH